MRKKQLKRRSKKAVPPSALDEYTAKVAGVEAGEAKAYLGKTNCTIASAHELGATEKGKKYFYSLVFCIGDFVVNPGGIHESKGCTLYVLDTKKGMAYGIDERRHDWPQVPKSCGNGGLEDLINKKWAETTVGKMFLSGNRSVGVDLTVVYSENSKATETLNRLVGSKK